MKTLYILTLFVIGHLNLQGQDIIEIINPSFEGEAGNTRSGRFHLKGWWDCGSIRQTPPDIHSHKTTLFGVSHFPYDGNTFLGMVTRQNGTWERINQKLQTELLPDNQYSFQIKLCKSDYYMSQLSGYINVEKFNFNQPIIIRIWGGTSYCNQKELLAQSTPISNTEWKTYEFNLNPKYSATHIEIEAYCPTDEPCNGNVLLDNMTDIVKINSINSK